MKKLDVRHYLDIYGTRKQMQDEGITNPSEQIKKFTSDFAEILQSLPQDEEIILKANSFYNSREHLLIKVPD